MACRHFGTKPLSKSTRTSHQSRPKVQASLLIFLKPISTDKIAKSWVVVDFIDDQMEAGVTFQFQNHKRNYGITCNNRQGRDYGANIPTQSMIKKNMCELRYIAVTNFIVETISYGQFLSRIKKIHQTRKFVIIDISALSNDIGESTFVAQNSRNSS